MATMLSSPVLEFCMLCLVSASFVLTHAASVESTDTVTYQLTLGIPQRISVSSNQTVILNVSDIRETSRFLVAQVHTQHARLTLTAVSESAEDSVTGNSVGMVNLLGLNSSSVSWSLETDRSSFLADHQLSVLVLIQQYGANVPVPGGCNQVFKLEIDPNIRLITSDYLTKIWFQWAVVGDSPGSCEEVTQTHRLSYTVYVRFVAENDDGVNALFDAVSSMLTVEKMRSNAQEILLIKNDGIQKSLAFVTSQRAQGAVYGVVVQDDLNGLSASYVSGITYGCNYTAGDCSLHYEALELVLVVMCAVTGVFLLVFGHGYFKTEMAVFGFVAAALVSFTLLRMRDSLSDEECFAIAAAFGVAGGVLWWLFWWKFTFPSLSVMLPGLCAGYLVAATLFLTPFANLSWWGSDLNYGLVFTCIVLVFAVILLCRPHALSIVSSALVGGYCLTMTAAILIRSSLKLIVLNSIHHSFVSGYATVTVISPFQLNDIILAVVWCVLIVLGISWQCFRFKGQPRFPNQHRYYHVNNDHIRNTIPPPDANERTPLLGHQEQPPPPSGPINASQHVDEHTPLLGHQE